MADELYPLAERNKFPWQLADALFLRGWLAAQQGGYDAGIDQMVRMVNLPYYAGFRPILLIQIIEQQLRAGLTEQA